MSLPPHLAERLERQLRLAEQARALWPAEGRPYLGHLRLESEGRVREVLLADQARRGPLEVLAWPGSRLTGLFLGAGEGEDFELEAAGARAEGRVLERNLVAFEGGALSELAGPGFRLVRGPGGWRQAEPGPTLRPRAPEARAEPTALLDVTLDPTQQRLVDLPADRSLLVLGEAGFGKTTVALRRLLRLRSLAPQGRSAAGSGFRAAVVVPTEGLRRLTEQVLRAQGAAHVEVWLYDAWARALALRAFPDLPRREGVGAPAGAVRLKRHPALRLALAELAEHPPALLDEEGHDLRRGAPVHRGDLEHLFGDRALLARVAQASGGALTPVALAEVAEHTRLQFSLTAEEAFAHITDREALRTLDGCELDEGTPEAAAGTLDPEDCAVLFELERLRARRKPLDVGAYDCLVLDEAQEFAPLELALLGRSLKPGGVLIAAGDDAQQVDPASAFGGWPATLAELGRSQAQVATLEISHRCPPEVAELARPLRHGGAPTPAGQRSDPVGPGVPHARLPSGLHLRWWLGEALAALEAADPGARVAVICRDPEGARALHEHLRHATPARLVREGRFDLRPGVQVACVQEVKGLEFDHVVIPDADARTYPATPEARRALYVAITRAVHGLALAAPAEGSALLAW